MLAPLLRRGLLTLAALLASASAAAQAGPLVDVAVVDRQTGQWLPQYPYRGDRWVAGTPGDLYTVRLTNTTGERVLVVLSVDGVNAVTGETAHPSQAGYVLEPWETADIAGWRKSLEDIAAFVFTDRQDSYAARTGRPGNLGVIGIAAFREARRYQAYPVQPLPPVTRGRRGPLSRHAAPAAEASGATPAGQIESAGTASQHLGTGHGEREWAPVGSTRFLRASHLPEQISEVRYDEPRRLQALGVLPHPYRHDRNRPRAFPQGFVPDPPPRWR